VGGIHDSYFLSLFVVEDGMFSQRRVPDECRSLRVSSFTRFTC